METFCTCHKKGRHNANLKVIISEELKLWLPILVFLFQGFLFYELKKL